MRCPRCGHRIRGASWYCPNCGAGTDNLEADVLRDQRRRRYTAGALAAVAAMAGIALWLGARPAPPRVAVAPTPFPTAPPILAPTSTPRRQPARPEAAPSPTVAAPDAAASARPTPRLRPDSPAWPVARLPEPPALDGWLDDWSGTPLGLAAIVDGEAAWSGADDLSARALVGWDDEALYLGARVFDGWFEVPPAGAAMDGGDHVVLQLDADIYGDWDGGTYDIDDWLIGLSPGDLAGRAPEGWVWRPRLGATEAGAVRVAARRLADGYTIEAAVPWALIGFGPPRQPAMGFALAVVDVDSGADGAPAARTTLATSPERTPDDPRTLGALVFE